jgi:hypothetical protein
VEVDEVIDELTFKIKELETGYDDNNCCFTFSA